MMLAFNDSEQDEKEKSTIRLMVEKFNNGMVHFTVEDPEDHNVFQSIFLSLDDSKSLIEYLSK